MGRKKIEIRPLVDERNRNVTFLKRKAGLMKKAWELSVLCAADVSILIFSSTGKAYEFSSKDLDEEIDKYLEYEGLIERRRAPEFAAMALAGEDEEDDEDEAPARRGSTSKAGLAANGAPQPKSLKGKESFKSRSISRADMNRALSRAKDGRRKGKSKRRSRHGRVDDRRSFVEGLLSEDESESEEGEGYDRPSEDERRKRKRRDRDEQFLEDDNHSGLAGLQYAMNLHGQSSGVSSADPNGHQRGLGNVQLPMTLSRPILRPEMQYPTYGLPPVQQQDYPPHMPSGSVPALPSGMQWDQNLLARYAEFQLQQNHQRQQRLLLERQRAQLQELGIPIEDKTLLDQLFGGSASHNPTQSSNIHSHQSTPQHQPAQHEMPTIADHFEWPTANGQMQSNRPHNHSPIPVNKESHPVFYNDLGAMQHIIGATGHQQQQQQQQHHHHHETDHIPWGVGTNDDTMPFPSPASPGMDDRGKRDREYEDDGTRTRI